MYLNINLRLPIFYHAMNKSDKIYNFTPDIINGKLLWIIHKQI
ncbi:hypothetical protein GGR21_003030 [Dysgonomonas hofstadii]|uniref:Uncharacterized protein n=1 Tax=Dysgonomonas hofstadii TaxID=637886 RepID=A0A840CWE4_9BACT|nr:hypothetical protein [Dysgonomonas hofstadii]